MQPSFLYLKREIGLESIVVTPYWKFPFELMCNASDYVVGAMLGQKKDKVFYAIYYASKSLNAA